MKSPSKLPVILTLRAVLSRDDRDLLEIDRSEQMRILLCRLSVLDTAMHKLRELQRIASQGGPTLL
jgi:hypothetical protein